MYVIEDGVIKITSKIYAEVRLHSVVYNVRDLAESGYEADALMKLIQAGSSGPWQLPPRGGVPGVRLLSGYDPAISGYDPGISETALQISIEHGLAGSAPPGSSSASTRARAASASS